MAQPASLDYNSAFRYVAAWAIFDHDDVTDLKRNPTEFHGKLGSLNFQYSQQDQTLHAWSFAMAGAGPLLTTRAEIKTNMDKIAQRQPEETAGGVFDIRTLEWNSHISPKLEPCLYLRLDIIDNATAVDIMVKKLNSLSTAGYIWHRQKVMELIEAFWKAHPEAPK